MLKGMPNIPDFKGLASAGTGALISFGGAALINKIFGKRWGIFNEYGIPILLADSVVSLQYSNSSAVSNAPIEAGSFASYNKVQEPYQATVQLSKGSGGALQRGLFLAQLETLSKSTLKFHIITPEYVYTNATIVGMDVAREASDGAQLIKVNLHLEEIREVKVQYSLVETAQPSDSATKDIGQQAASEIGGDNRSGLHRLANSFGNTVDKAKKAITGFFR